MPSEPHTKEEVPGMDAPELPSPPADDVPEKAPSQL